jgi:signal peptidase I
MSLNIDSWFVKIAIVVALIAAREFVRLLSPREATGAVNENAKWLLETLDSAAIAIGLVLFIIQPFLLQAFFIPSGSMEDTLRINDRLLVSKLVYRLREPRFQEVVVFLAPPEAQREVGGQDDFIKRCMGTPGDTIYVQNRQYFRKGRGEQIFTELKEPYIKWSPQGRGALYSYDMKIIDGVIYSREYSQPGALGVWTVNGTPVAQTDQERVERAEPQPIPAGMFLMLGDHRNNSNDSHAWGFVPRANIVGKAVCVFWPPTRVGLVDQMSFHPRPPQDDNLPVPPATALPVAP